MPNNHYTKKNNKSNPPVKKVGYPFQNWFANLQEQPCLSWKDYSDYLEKCSTKSLTRFKHATCRRVREPVLCPVETKEDENCVSNEDEEMFFACKDPDRDVSMKLDETLCEKFDKKRMLPCWMKNAIIAQLKNTSFPNGVVPLNDFFIKREPQGQLSFVTVNELRKELNNPEGNSYAPFHYYLTEEEKREFTTDHKPNTPPVQRNVEQKAKSFSTRKNKPKSAEYPVKVTEKEKRNLTSLDKPKSPAMKRKGEREEKRFSKLSKKVTAPELPFVDLTEEEPKNISIDDYLTEEQLRFILGEDIHSPSKIDVAKHDQGVKKPESPLELTEEEQRFILGEDIHSPSKIDVAKHNRGVFTRGENPEPLLKLTKDEQKSIFGHILSKSPFIQFFTVPPPPKVYANVPFADYNPYKKAPSEVEIDKFAKKIFGNNFVSILSKNKKLLKEDTSRFFTWASKNFTKYFPDYNRFNEYMRDTYCTPSNPDIKCNVLQISSLKNMLTVYALPDFRFELVMNTDINKQKYPLFETMKFFHMCLSKKHKLQKQVYSEFIPSEYEYFVFLSQLIENYKKFITLTE